MFLIFLPKINILIYHFIPPEMRIFLAVPKRENNRKEAKKMWNLAHDYLHRLCDILEGSRG
jgi:hypothetical protein